MHLWHQKLMMRHACVLELLWACASQGETMDASEQRDLLIDQARSEAFRTLTEASPSHLHWHRFESYPNRPTIRTQ